MERLVQYFSKAHCCTPENRQLGVEIETLFVDREGHPITRYVSQSIFQDLVSSNGWQIMERVGGFFSRIRNLVGWELSVDLGWNNIELIPGPEALSSFSWDAMNAVLGEVYRVAATHSAYPLFGPHDDSLDVDTLAVPDERDRVWIELDGQLPLQTLGHIASIHYNVDLVSPEEGIEWIADLNKEYYPKILEVYDTPAYAHNSVWRRYIKESLAGYEDWRFGYCPGQSLELYCWWLSVVRVVMNKMPDGSLYRCLPARSFAQTEDPDIDLFLRSVWWYTRMRVRGGNLVMEIRNVPRFEDEAIEREWDVIKGIVSL